MVRLAALVRIVPFLAAIPAGAQPVLWDTGSPHQVVFNGTLTYLGYTSGALSGAPQRWAAVPFRVLTPQPIEGIDVDFFVGAGSEPANIRYAIFQRFSLSNPGSLVHSGVLGPLDPGIDDPRDPVTNTWLHEYRNLSISLPVGDYYITFYGDGIGAGNTTGFGNIGWITGGELQQESLEQSFLWRASAWPSPGFQVYNPSTIQPDAGQDPDDRWNCCFRLLGHTPAPPPVNYAEVGDAPQSLPAQYTTNNLSSPFNSIGGNISFPADVDLYYIRIVDRANFSARTLGGAAFDTQLWLFRPDGKGVAFNDDSDSTTQSKIDNLANLITENGVYILGISSYDNDALAGGLEMWLDQPFASVRPPDGPGGIGPFDGWDGGGSGQGPYRIELVGCEPFPCITPVITQHPEYAAFKVGTGASFSVDASNGTPLSYQWFLNGRAIAGATSPTYSFSNGTFANAGKMYCEVSTPCGTVRSRAAVAKAYNDACPPLPQNECRVPERWKAGAAPWMWDVAGPNGAIAGNRIDNRIDVDHVIHPTARYSVFVCCNVPIPPALAAGFESISPVSSVARNFCPGGVSALLMRNVSYSECQTLTSYAEVARIEYAKTRFHTTDTTSVQAIRERGPAHSPNTVEDVYSNVDGRGVTVAIVDTGIDDYHDWLRPAVAGYNSVVIPPVEENPDDNSLDGHGTLIADIIGGDGPTPGVAKGVDFIDVKALSFDGFGDADQVALAEAWIITNIADLGIDIVCMAFAGVEKTDGSDVVSLLANMISDTGPLVIAAGGDGSGPVEHSPGVAAEVIAVGAVDDQGTGLRTDDTIASFSPTGPDFPEGESQRKPECVAPGVSITGALNNTTAGSHTLSGTSMAAAHVAGVAALYRQELFLAASEFREIIKQTSWRPPGVLPTIPDQSDTWNASWGNGLIDAFAIVDASPICITDVTFRIEPGTGAWQLEQRRNIQVNPDPPHFGQPTELRCSLRNFGTTIARSVVIEWRTFAGNASNPIFEVLGRTVPFDIPGTPSGGVPQLFNSPPFIWYPYVVQGSAHQCLRARIIYNKDCNWGNNETQRNVDPTSSPTYFFAVNAHSGVPVTMGFDVEIVGGAQGWSYQITPPGSFTLAPGEFRSIRFLPLPPPGANAGDAKEFNVRTVGEDGCDLGYLIVTTIVKDCNGNHIDDWFDINSGVSLDVNTNGIPDECDCFADFDHNGESNSNDVTAYLNQFFLDQINGTLLADFDHNGETNSNDVSAFLNRWFADLAGGHC